MEITVMCDKCNHEIKIEGSCAAFRSITLYTKPCPRCLELAKIQTEDGILSDKPKGNKNDNT